uniref:Neur_chan_LBD domain-containing protein n=1 Tax=Steinernema glaseri TaxID=37863 RepID=A0A1I8AEZ8_9BILA
MLRDSQSKASYSRLVDLEMLFPALLLLLLSQVGEATLERKRYNLDGHRLDVRLKVHALSGTGSEVWFSFGNMLEGTDLIHRYDTGSWYQYDSDIHSAHMTVVDVNVTVEWLFYEHLEQGCFANTTSQADYNKCLTHPNVALIGLHEWKPEAHITQYPWTLDKIEATFDVTYNEFAVDATWLSEPTNVTKEITGSVVFLSTEKPLVAGFAYHLEESKNGERHAVVEDKRGAPHSSINALRH